MALSHRFTPETETQQCDRSVITRFCGDQPTRRWPPQRLSPAHGNGLKGVGLEQAVANGITLKDIEDAAASDEGRKAAMKKVLLDPFEQVGYDFDAALRDCAVRVRDGNLSPDQATAARSMMSVYAEQAADLVRWGLIKEETRDLVLRVLKI